MITITAFVDASHATDKKTRKLHTRFIVFISRAPILWHSEKQQPDEASTFYSESIAMEKCVEPIQQIRFKLKMFGIPLEKG